MDHRPSSSTGRSELWRMADQSIAATQQSSFFGEGHDTVNEQFIECAGAV
jgi:hypothetical protein